MLNSNIRTFPANRPFAVAKGRTGGVVVALFCGDIILWSNVGSIPANEFDGLVQRAAAKLRRSLRSAAK